MGEEQEHYQYKYTKEDYNNIPVYFCKECLSLLVRQYDEKTNYCDKCGSTDIEVTTIDKWQELYKDKYGKNLI